VTLKPEVIGMQKGYIQVYTGNGKGKTTAAIGQAVRAAGYGLRSYIIQFMKEYPYSELKSLKRFEDLITIEQCGKDDFVYKKESPPKEQMEKVSSALNSAMKKMLSKEYDIIILDEVLVSIYFGLFKTEQILDFIKAKPETVELILTGRYCPQEIIDAADLVTEMKEVKHYYSKGVLSRKGIES
jgi:cob(I)alamin adenosyltransferase